MTGSTLIRVGTAVDRRFVAELGAGTVSDSVAPFRSAEQAMVEMSFERLLNFVWEQSHILLVALNEDRRVGFLLLLDTFPDEVTGMPQAFIAYMAVKPEYRRQGIGSALLHRAEVIARDLGLPYMALMVTEHNEAGRVVYENAGYITERRLLCKIL
ncbi:MAG: GNAT family N-acetyltransferase [Candidatus Eremiobacteraeota bacterium]|nr:GNAT family N-acetyltransferase [Candidatus Eremiobacteraeota bacterium]